ncbi:MAG TPA: hypothetical protein VK876_01945 [Rubrivivax sp.]|nr:hypothetical protein [Rubrivivax sp.]
MTGASEPDSQALVEIIELKWLLAGEGFHVHVERLQTDRDYARQALHRAQESPNAALRETAARLRTKLQLAES